jgi:hypothetical protein
MTPAIDYTGIRITLISAIHLATGLPAERIIGAQPESADAPQPAQPYFTIQVTDTERCGWDWHEQASDTAPTEFSTTGPRGLQVSFNCIAATHEDAQALMTLWQASLQSLATQEILRNANLAVWRCEQIRDLSELYDTGYQPRAYMQVTIGATSRVVSPFDTIDSVVFGGKTIGPIQG